MTTSRLQNILNGNSEDDENGGLPLILNRPFFVIKEMLTSTDHHRRNNGLVAVCLKCCSKIKGSKKVTSNFIEHYKHQHLEEYIEYKNKKDSHKSVRNFNKQTKFDDKVLKFLISSFSPMSVLENEDFRALFHESSVKPKSRKNMQNLLEQKCKNMVLNIKDLIKNVEYICCTADIWSGKRKSYFGYTAHWIQNDLVRNSAVLACRRFKSPHTYTHIASIIETINYEYGINEDKVTCTVTDNGSNFVKAFKEYGVNISDDIESDNELQLSEFPKFKNYTSDSIDDESFKLSKHYRCASHTLNLLTTTDYMKILKKEKLIYERHINALAKCESIWSKTKRPKAYEQIYEIINAMLKTPTVTRWNSLFDSIQHLLLFREKFNELTNIFGIENFLFEDIEYLEEYVKVMKPLAEALDFLQSEKNIYFGYLLPTLLTLKLKLRKVASTVSILGNVARELIRNLEIRFRSIFILDKSSHEVVVAAITCPQVRFLKCVKLIDVWKETSSFINETFLENLVVSYLPKDIISDKSEHVKTISNLVGAHNFFHIDESEDEDTETEVFNYNEIRKDLINFSKENGNPLHDLQKYNFIKNMFIKSNTPLPSSAPVERLFSLAGMVNGQRRQRLTDTNFENFVLAKANSKYF